MIRTALLLTSMLACACVHDDRHDAASSPCTPEARGPMEGCIRISGAISYSFDEVCVGNTDRIIMGHAQTLMGLNGTSVTFLPNGSVSDLEVFTSPSCINISTVKRVKHFKCSLVSDSGAKIDIEVVRHGRTFREPRERWCSEDWT